MLHRRLARATAVAALLALPAAVPPVAHAAKKPKQQQQAEPEFTVTGTFSVTSTITTVCPKPSYGDDVVVTEQAITIRRYTFSGTSGTAKSPGRLTSKGEETVETDTKVAGDTDLLRDQHLGPVKKAIPGSTTSWNATVEKGMEGKGRHRHGVLRFDMTGLTGSNRKETMFMPRRGQSQEHFLVPNTRGYKDRKEGACTYSDQTFTSGFITVTRRT